MPTRLRALRHDDVRLRLHCLASLRDRLHLADQPRARRVYPMDRFGYLPVAAMSILAIPVVGAIGYVGTTSEPLLIVVLFLAGFSVLGFNYATNGVSGIVYPTAFRALGSGWCFAVGRAGSVSGPVIGGVLIGMHVSVQHLYLFAAIPYLICAPVALVFAGIYRRRMALAAGSDVVAVTSPREAEYPQSP